MIQLYWLIALAIGVFGVIGVVVWGWIERAKARKHESEYGQRVLQLVLDDVKSMSVEDYEKWLTENNIDPHMGTK